MIRSKSKKNKKNPLRINKFTKYKDKRVDYYIVSIHIQRKLQKKCFYEVFLLIFNIII